MACRPVWQLAHHLCANEWLGQERGARSGVEKLQREQIVRIKIEAFALDSTSVKVHPDGTGALKKTGRRPSAIPRRMEHQNSYGCRECSNGHNLPLSPGNAHDAPEGRALLSELGPMPEKLCLLMDRAYEGDETRQLVLTWAWFRWCRRSPTGSSRGNTTVPSTRNAMRSNGSSAAQRLPPHLLAIRETGRRLRRLSLLCTHRRSSEVSVNTP